MTDTALTLNLSVYILTAMGLTLLGFLFSLISLVGTIRTGSLSRLFYTFFSFFLTLYALVLWLPATGFRLLPEGFPGQISVDSLFYLTVLFYAIHYHMALKARSHSHTLVALIVIFIYLTGLMLISHLSRGSGSFIMLVRNADWNSIIIAATGLFLLVRVIMAFCFHESGAGWGTVSLLVFIIPPLLAMIISGSVQGFHIRSFTLFSLPLLAAWEFTRLFTAPFKGRDKEAPRPVGELREQLSDSRSRQNNLNSLLLDREEELGKIIARARKVSRSLLPAVIHHDGLWEVTTFFNPVRKSGEKDLFDFYYTYGRRIAGVSLFSTPEEPEGALYGAVLKKEWSEGFNESGTLASLYRRIDSHLKEIFENTELRGAALKLHKEKVEYTGFGNPSLYYMNGKLNKSAPLIQDRADSVSDIKSYSVPCSPGDSFLICNDVFLNKTAPVTDRAFSKEKLPELLESFKGKSSDMVRELIDGRNKFLGRKDEADILVIYVKRKD